MSERDARVIGAPIRRTVAARAGSTAFLTMTGFACATSSCIDRSRLADCRGLACAIYTRASLAPRFGQGFLASLGGLTAEWSVYTIGNRQSPQLHYALRLCQIHLFLH
ncbi:hypothetical protein EVAR_70849_1 [Eumeta japonica]|uniref:Uncharacterized protein n=1 Tax=Eumeta variegata TaxID=151549 RepID=A0A4C1SAK7_EUMVA|nr:hypothetical protein EVAR_70849_1 [Eumeta japonica]